MADSRQPAQRVLIFRFLGKVPLSIFRYRVDRLRPVRSSTASSRRMRWGVVVSIGITLLEVRFGEAPQDKVGQELSERKEPLWCLEGTEYVRRTNVE